MNQPKIKFRDMLIEMESSNASFSLTWVELSLTRGTGGKVVSNDSLVLKRNPIGKKKKTDKPVPLNSLKRSIGFNLYDTQNKRYIHAYKRIITDYNGQTVTP